MKDCPVSSILVDYALTEPHGSRPKLESDGRQLPVAVWIGRTGQADLRRCLVAKRAAPVPLARGAFSLSISTGSMGPSLGDDKEAPLIPAGLLLPFIVVTALFFLWAIPNNLNDILIKQFMKSFAMNRSGAAQVQMAVYLGYFLLAIPAGQLMRRFGYKTGVVIGLVLLGCGCWMFYPAAQAGVYGFFLAAEFVIASGLSFLETAANPFFAQ